MSKEMRKMIDKFKNFGQFVNEQKKSENIYKETELIWIQAEKIKNGDIHQYDDGAGWKIAKVISTKPILNGFKEIIGAYITWDDGTTDRYTGDLQIQPRKLF